MASLAASEQLRPLMMVFAFIIGQSVTGLIAFFLVVAASSDGLFSCWLGRWGLWHIVDGLRAFGLLSSNIHWLLLRR